MSSLRRVSAGQRRQMIAEAAYFRAEKRGFNAGDPLEDWYEAEREVDERLRQLESEDPLAGFDDLLAMAAKRLSALKRTVRTLSAEARAERQRDAERLAELREALRPQLDELRERGAEAAERVRQHAEEIGAEITQLLRKLGRKH